MKTGAKKPTTSQGKGGRNDKGRTHGGETGGNPGEVYFL